MADHVSLFRSSLLALTSCYSGRRGQLGACSWPPPPPRRACNGVRGSAAAVPRRGGAVPGARPRQRDAEPVPHPRRARRRHRHRHRHRGVARPARRRGLGGVVGRPPRDHPQRRALRARPRRRHGRVRSGRVHQDGGAVRASPRPSRSRRAAACHIVADTFVLPWAVGVGNRRGLPVCVLSPLSSTMFSVHYHFDRLPAAADIADGGDPCLVGSYIPGLKSIRLSDLGPSHTNKNMLNLILEAYSHVRKAHAVIFTSFYELESNAIDALRRELPYPVFSAGPCIPYMALESAEHRAGAEEQEEEEPYMAWLDAQPVGSVLYVSLGSFLSVSPAQLDEIAIGLADSKVTFLWVLRGDSGARDILRGGRDAGGGMVVPWTDQLKVLCHPSVGGFFTHSGMNSTLEAVRPADRRPARRRRVEDRVRPQGERRRRRRRREGGDRGSGEEADGFRCGGGRGEGDEEESFADARGLSRCGSSGWFFFLYAVFSLLSGAAA